MKEPGLIVFLAILAAFPFLAKLSAESLDWLLSKIRKPKEKKGGSEGPVVNT